MPAILLDLTIAPEEYLRLYQGSAEDVLAVSLDGRRVRFPARVLQRFVTRDGIRGRFRLSFDEQRRFVGIEKLG